MNFYFYFSLIYVKFSASISFFPDCNQTLQIKCYTCTRYFWMWCYSSSIEFFILFNPTYTLMTYLYIFCTKTCTGSFYLSFVMQPPLHLSSILVLYVRTKQLAFMGNLIKNLQYFIDFQATMMSVWGIFIHIQRSVCWACWSVLMIL